jgi:hypothetical protein
LGSAVAATLGERIVVTENGRRKRITKLEAAVKQLVNRAASGEARSMKLLPALVQSSVSHRAISNRSRPQSLFRPGGSARIRHWRSST